LDIINKKKNITFNKLKEEENKQKKHLTTASIKHSSNSINSNNNENTYKNDNLSKHANEEA
jgi:hypothetical protein